MKKIYMILGGCGVMGIMVFFIVTFYNMDNNNNGLSNVAHNEAKKDEGKNFTNEDIVEMTIEELNNLVATGITIDSEEQKEILRDKIMLESVASDMNYYLERAKGEVLDDSAELAFSQLQDKHDEILAKYPNMKY